MHLSISRSHVVTKAFVLCAITASLCAVASCGEGNGNAKNLPRSASAALHLTVFVVPVVRTGGDVVPKRESKSMIFTFVSPPLTQTHEVRTLPVDEDSHTSKQLQPAILRTLTVVPE